MVQIGAHVSISGGVNKAPARGKEIGCEAIQIFSKNQVQWEAPPLPEEMAGTFRSEMKNNGIKTAVVHDSYLINLCAKKPFLLQRSRESFQKEVERCDSLGIRILVFHPGSHVGQGEKKGIEMIIESLNVIIRALEGSKCKLVVETTAGQGTSIGYSFEHIASIVDGLDEKKRMGVCLDTCHSYAAGYDLGNDYDGVMDSFENIVGLRKISAFHANDARKGLGSRVDRHETIGNGMIGTEAFRRIVNDKRFMDVPMILEVPGGDEAFAKDIKLLKSMRE